MNCEQDYDAPIYNLASVWQKYNCDFQQEYPVMKCNTLIMFGYLKKYFPFVITKGIICNALWITMVRKHSSKDHLASFYYFVYNNISGA